MNKRTALFLLSYVLQYLKERFKELLKYVSITAFRAVVSAIIFVIGLLYVLDYVIKTLSVLFLMDESAIRAIVGILLLLVSYLVFPSLKK